MPRKELLLLALLLPFTLAAAPAPRVRFALSAASAEGSLPSLQCEVSFTGEADGSTELVLPDAWGGEQHLWRAIHDLSASGATLQPGRDSAHAVLQHAPGAAVTLRYRVEQDVPGLPEPTGRNPYRPTIQPGWFHVVGSTIAVLPAWPDDVPVDFAGGPWPAGWSFASDLEHGTRSAPLVLGSLRQSISVGGDFRVFTRPQGRSTTRVAIRGTWSFSDSSLGARLARVIASHRRFWGDADEPFLVTVLPLTQRPGATSLGGTGLGDAFAMFATDNAEAAQLDRLLAHEHMHTWLPGRVGGMPKQVEAQDYWLSEGFTEFYAMRLLVREGIWNARDWIDTANDWLRRYANSPLRTAPNDSAAALFWRNPDARDLPYQRGLLLAMKWDHELRERSRGAKSLDDVVRAMKRDAAAWKGDEPLMASALLRKHLAAAGVDAAGDIERHVVRGEAIVLPATVLGAGARLETYDGPAFHRGFNAEATNAAGGVVRGVVPGSPAEAAGLRDGMRIVKRESGRIGDASVPLVYRVQDGDSTRLVSYLPQGPGHTTLQTFTTADSTAPGLAKLAGAIAGGAQRVSTSR